ncbi:MAG: hypothetical protein N2748_00345 [candidate division WOR-3 bacterium]|nr:hypothetical protein [candidate division WOR-3 bacterium]
MKAYFLPLMLIAILLACKSAQTAKKTFWHKDGYFVQNNIDLKNYDKGIIRARVEGKWQNFKIQQLPGSFVKWSIDRRLQTLARIRENKMPSLAGSHNGMVASHGLKRADAQFSINCAVKGMGFIPKPEKIEEILNLLKSTFDSSDAKKLAILESLYKQGEEIFDLTKQVSLELYATPNFETHTFLNQMTDPGVAIVFLDFPSYELRAITQMLHPNNPNLSKYERNVVDYINTIHDYFHAKSPRPSIAVIYHIIEVFDNTPGKARGQRIVPPLP